MATRIKEKYLAEAIPALEEKFGYKNAMQVPKLAKIVRQDRHQHGSGRLQG